MQKVCCHFTLKPATDFIFKISSTSGQSTTLQYIKKWIQSFLIDIDENQPCLKTKKCGYCSYGNLHCLETSGK